MDGKAERLRSLGVFGIVWEAWKILHSRANLFGTLTLALILPISVANLVHTLSSLSLLRQILSIGIFHPPGSAKLSRQLTEFLVMEAIYAVYAFATWIVSTSAVVYSVSCLYTVKNVPSFATVMKMASIAWKRVAITSIWFFFIMLGICAVSGLGWVLQIWGSGMADKAFAFIMGMVICVGILFMSVYVTMVWHLATVMSVLEDKYYGLEAMKRSHYLLEGKRDTALRVTVSYVVMEGVYYYGVGAMRGHRESYVYTVLLVANSVISLMWALWQSVLYFVCKDFHDEESTEYVLPLTTCRCG